MILEFVVEEGIIRQAAFQTYGCVTARACGSLVTTILTGRPVESALKLTAEDVLKILGKIPEGKEGVADLAVVATRKALNGD